MNSKDSQPARNGLRSPENGSQAREAYLASVFRATPTGIGVVVDRVFVRVNQRLCEMTGYAEAELLGQSARMLYRTDADYEYVGREKYAQIQTHGTGTVETRWQHKDGRMIDVLLSSTPLDFDDLARGVTFTALDITTRKQAEAALRESRHMLQLVLDTIPARVFWKDLNLNYLGCNHLFARDAGLASPKEIVGRSDYQLGWTDQSERYRQDDLAVIQSGEPKINYEEPQTTPKGGLIWLRTSKIPLRDDVGRIIGVMGTYEEITELKRAEAQIYQLQKSESLGRMAGAIAHHFNNMLGVVLGNLELVMQTPPSEPAARDMLDKAMEASRQATTLSSQILAYLGQTAGRREALDLAEICRSTLSSVSSVLLENLRTNLPSQGPLVLADRSHIKQIFINLLLNAEEAIVYGRDSISVSITEIAAEAIPAQPRVPADWQPDASAYACLTVSDTGCGMTPYDLAQAFDPFFSTKFTGRGLGLPVVLGLVKAHKGVLTLESQPGRGTNCRVCLPVYFPGLAQPVQTTLPAPAPSQALVLVVDDVPEVRDLGKTMLENIGYTVITAASGPEALKLFEKHAIDIGCVLLDLTMPGMDGWQTLVALRKLRPDIPVVLCSGYDPAHVMAQAQAEIPQSFLHKPYRMEELKGAVAGAMGMR